MATETSNTFFGNKKFEYGDVAAPGAASSEGGAISSCKDPPGAAPAYDDEVLSAFYAAGKVTRAQRDLLRAGTLLVEQLTNLTPQDRLKLKCGPDALEASLDPHDNPAYPPAAFPLVAGLLVTLDPHPTDAAHRLLITVPAGGVVAGTELARVRLSQTYVDNDGIPRAPLVDLTGVGGAATYRPSTVNPDEYVISTDGALAAGTFVVQSVVTRHL
jgi:hypothetical protein